ncbi:MAG TPA: DM13 domain-containing protein [Burkholderiales bacterium]|jgi:hypothetical protein
MRRYFLLLLTGLVLGGVAGFAGGIFVYPYLFLDDIVATEPIVDAPSRTLVATGRFIHANTSDPIHYGNGSVKVYQNLLRLESDFQVGPGPKYHVYLVPGAEVTPSTAVEKTMFVDLGRLRAFKGSQNYPIPAGVDIKNYSHAVIWCEQFSVLISPARLEHRQ